MEGLAVGLLGLDVVGVKVGLEGAIVGDDDGRLVGENVGFLLGLLDGSDDGFMVLTEDTKILDIIKIEQKLTNLILCMIGSIS